MQPYTIHSANWRDLGDLRRIEEEVFPKDAWPIWDLVGVLTLPSTVRLKAVTDGHMIGFAAGDPRRREDTGWVTTIGVLKAFQHNGIGAALLAATEQQLALPRIRLCVRRSNLPAVHLYEHAGYKQVEVWNAYYNDGEDGLIFEKISPLMETKD